MVLEGLFVVHHLVLVSLGIARTVAFTSTWEIAMSRAERCSETHIRDIDGNKLPVRACEVEIDGTWRPMAVKARNGVTSGALVALGASGARDLTVRVECEYGEIVETVVDAGALHRRQPATGPSDMALVKLSFLSEVSGRRLNDEAVAAATKRLSLTLTPGAITDFLGASATVLRHAEPSGGLDAMRDNLRDTVVLDDILATSRRPRRGSDIVYEAPEFTLVPQANSLANISAVVDAIADGCCTTGAIAEAIGMSGRQGGYYPSAAHTLGLVQEINGTPPYDWELTSAGAAFVGLDAAGRVDYLHSALSEIEWIATFVKEGPEALRADWTFDHDLSEQTLTRRLATIATWVAFMDSPRAAQTKKIAEAMTGTRERAPGVLQRVQEAARARMQRNVKLDARKCPKCHIRVAAALHECENCGTPIAA